MKDYYHILGVAATAADEEIKTAYRRLAKQYHPDVNRGEKSAEERFKEISEAYNVLSDPKQRAQYDLLRRTGGGRPFSGFDPRGFTGGFGGAQSVGDLGDLLNDLFNMGGIRRGPFRADGEEAGQTSAVEGQDTITDIEIAFNEAIEGAERKLSIKRGDRTEKITVKIPAGVDNGSKVRIAGKGQPGFGGGKPGDLYLHIRVTPHPLFWRELEDIYTEVPITIYDAVLGAAIEVPTFSGHVTMKIPVGTAGGQKFRLAGKGAPIVGKKGKRGDQFVIVRIVPPKEIAPQLKEAIEKLKHQFPYDPQVD